MGWGPSEAARELKKDQGDVSRWRAGKRPIPREVLEAAATAAGETESYFTRSTEQADADRHTKTIVAAWLETEAQRLRQELRSPEGAALDAVPDSEASVDADASALPKKTRKRRSG